MISLAGRDILHSWGKFVLTGVGLGLLIGVTLTMAGVYRGMVDDARALLDNSGADLWVVQQGTQGPYAESSSLRDDVVRSVLGLPGVARAANVTYLTMQVREGASPMRVEAREVRAMIVGFEPGQPGEPGYLVAGRHITRGHYEAVVDVRTGYKLGQLIRIRRHDYMVVGLTQRMVSSGGDPMVFIPLKDAQEAQFLKDNDAILNDRARTAANPALNRPGVPGLLEAIQASQVANRNVNTVLVQVQPGVSAQTVAEPIRRWKHLEAYTRVQMEEILVAKLIATSGEADRYVPGHFGHRQCSDRCLHHLHDDLGKDPRNRGAQAHRHPQPNHRRHDPAAGTWAGPDRFRRRQGVRHVLGAHLPKVCAARSERCTARVRRGDGDLRAGQHAGDPRGAQGRSGCGHRRVKGANVSETGIRIEGLRKRYGEGDTAVDALKDVNMVVASGEVVGLIGPSGSGKSTLLKCLGAVIEPTGGRMILGGQTIYDHGWKIPDLRALRRDSIGFVFQAPYLIPFLDVTDNVALLPMLAGCPNSEARARALELLVALDVGHRAEAATVRTIGRRTATCVDRAGPGQPAAGDPR